MSKSNIYHTNSQRTGRKRRTHIMKIIFIKLPRETREIVMFQHPWEDGFCEFVHVLFFLIVSTYNGREIAPCGPTHCIRAS